jgi:hypothetical protein
MTENIKFRPIDALKARYEALQSWDALSRRIAETSGNKKDRRVDRRKLKALCEGKNVSLSVSELLALNEYLRKFREGLDEKPLFIRQDDILESLAESENLVIFVPAKYHMELRTEAVSRWDMRAVALFPKTKLGGKNIDIQDVLLPRQIERIKENSEAWVGRLSNPEAKICIGSPLACAASEYLISQMVGRTPYTRTPVSNEHPLPLYFIFPDKEIAACPSTFFVNRAEAKALLGKEEGEKLKKMDENGRGMIVLKKLFISSRIGLSYGVLVAQRQRVHGQVVMSLSGTYGPTTLAIARVIWDHQINATLPPLDERSEYQPILIAVVEAKTEPRAASQAEDGCEQYDENRKLVSQKVVMPPQLLYFSDGTWVER